MLKAKKHILVLNWRDPTSPLEGGAERFTKKYAEYWAANGCRVTWLTNKYKQLDIEEVINGITYLRIGPELNGTLINYLLFYPIYLVKTILFIKTYLKENVVDIIIDEIHGLSFFTPLLSKGRIVLLVCEVAGEIWYKMFPFPINIIGANIEKLIYGLYKNAEIWAISENTKNNINDILPDKQITLIDLGIENNRSDMQKIKNVKKTPFPSAVFLARLVRMKGIETAIRAAAEISKEFPNFMLYLIGSGTDQYQKKLEKMVANLGIQHNIIFCGFKDGVEKYALLKKAHVLLHPSFKEGFGLTVIEAGLVGTPAIVRSGSSLDALVKDNVNGFSFKRSNEILDLFKIITNPTNSIRFQKAAIGVAENYLWPSVLERSRKSMKVI